MTLQGHFSVTESSGPRQLTNEHNKTERKSLRPTGVLTCIESAFFGFAVTEEENCYGHLCSQSNDQ